MSRTPPPPDLDDHTAAGSGPATADAGVRALAQATRWAESVAADPRRQLERAERKTRLMGQLTDRERDVLALRLVARLSAEEAGAVLGLTEGAVRMSQHHALLRLRALLAMEP